MVNVSLVIDNQLYGQPVFVSIGQTEEQFRQSAAGVLYQPEIDEYALQLYHKVSPAGCCFDTPGKIITVWVCDLNRDPCWHGTIGHEVFHAVEAVMLRVNIRYAKASCEAFAFLIGYITEAIYGHLMKEMVL